MAIGASVTSRQESQVLIVGAGPVGLTLAMDLARRGATVTIAETRSPHDRRSVKSNHVSARSMEMFRRLGVARAVREAGLPDDHPHDVAYRTTFTGEELSRIHIPGRLDRYTDKSGPDGWWPTPEPPHRINQMYLEPILFEHAARTPGVQIRSRTRVDAVSQHEYGVVAKGVDLDSGLPLEFRCDYLVGCDGARSTVRKAIGAQLLGDEVVGRVQSTYLRAPGLLERARHGPAWATFSLNPRRSGNVYAIDGRETFLLHNYLKPHETFESVDRDRAIRDILGVSSELRYEILSKEDWIGRRLVTDRLRDGRVFICGDAAHLWVPMAGYGMNAGIADATNLSWLLAARLNGWAEQGILAAYEAERLPITEQVSRFAMEHALALQRELEVVPEGLEEHGPAADARRAAAGRALYDLNVKQYCCAGLNFGYFYDASPVISYDFESQPPYTMDWFQPSTVPGCRAPHAWLADGRSLYDAFGPEFTLLRMNSEVDPRPLLAAAQFRHVPLTLLDANLSGPSSPYRHNLILVRPDQHVAWRADHCPEAPLDLIDLIRGANRTD